MWNKTKQLLKNTELMDEIVSEYKKGRPLYQLAEMAGCAKTSIEVFIERYIQMKKAAKNG